MLSIDQPRNFLAQSKENGWAIYAGVTPEDDSESLSATRKQTDASNKPTGYSGSVTFTAARSSEPLQLPHVPLIKQPGILVLGGEGSGVKMSLQKHADFMVSMRAAKCHVECGVDSLNVSVAAAVLLTEFLRKPNEEELAKAASDITESVKHDSVGELGI